LSHTELKDAIPGFVITLTIAVIAFLASLLHPTFDALVISIIFGMLVSNLIEDREMLKRGRDLALRVFIPVGISLYGAQIVFADTDVRLLPVVFTVFLFIFCLTYLISRGFGLGKKLSILLGTGLSVCGAAAIAVVAPILHSKDEDTSISIISVMTIGLTGMLVYRFMPDVIGFSPWKFAFLTGMTLPMFGQVKVASATMGQESLLWATNIKLIRVSFLVLVAGLAIVISRKEKRKLHVPWFMAVFFAMALAVNVSELFASFREFFEPLSKFSLAAALSAIGLSLDFDSITEGGTSPLYAACLSWGIFVLTIYLVLSVIL
jgi:uncharacterized integral membrane protein (TIGR00698 family)